MFFLLAKVTRGGLLAFVNYELIMKLFLTTVNFFLTKDPYESDIFLDNTISIFNFYKIKTRSTQKMYETAEKLSKATQVSGITNMHRIKIVL